MTYAVGLATTLPLTVPSPVLSQTLPSVQGRVYASDTGVGLADALVILDGHGSTLTSATGAFRFDSVGRGERTLTVEAFGYSPARLRLDVRGDAVSVDVPMEVAPFALDSLLVDLETFDLEGRVEDTTRDIRLVDAEVFTSQGHSDRTDAHGQFDLEDVYQDVPLRLRIRAFGYMPLDSTFVPDPDQRHDFSLLTDPVMQRVIERQSQQIEEVTTGRRAVGIRPMDRDAILRYAGTFTLYDVLLAEYRFRLDRISCLVVDEEQILYQRGWTSFLSSLLPEEVDRIDFMFQGAMLRIYTRDFVRRMATSNIELRSPSYFRAGRGEALCS